MQRHRPANARAPGSRDSAGDRCRAARSRRVRHQRQRQLAPESDALTTARRGRSQALLTGDARSRRPSSAGVCSGGPASAVGPIRNTYTRVHVRTGFHNGKHRLPRGKQTRVRRDLSVPLCRAGPRVNEGMDRHRARSGQRGFAHTFARLAVRGRSPNLRRRPLLRDAARGTQPADGPSGVPHRALARGGTERSASPRIPLETADKDKTDATASGGRRAGHGNRRGQRSRRPQAHGDRGHRETHEYTGWRTRHLTT